MKRIIESVKDNVVCLYKDRAHTEKFFVGYIIGYDDTYLLFECLDEDGTIDGVSVIRVEDIYLIETNNSYIDEIEKKGPKKIIIDVDNNNNIFQQYLEYVIKERKIVDIETNSSEKVDLHGVIIDIIDGWVKLEAYDEDAKDGVSFCRLENISMIDYA